MVMCLFCLRLLDGMFVGGILETVRRTFLEYGNVTSSGG